MTHHEKIVRSVKLSVDHLEASILALDKKDEDSFADSLWRSAEELEYVLFLFSLEFQNENVRSKWRSMLDVRKGDVGSSLKAAERLLNESRKSMIDESWLEAYESAYAARDYLLKLQEDLAKKKREAFKKK